MKKLVFVLCAAVGAPTLAFAASPDAGLNTVFQSPAPVTGATIDVTSFGATPNNNSDDDAIAINAAIASASSGDEVYLPDGVYNTMTRIETSSGVSVRGESEAGTIIRAGFSVAGEETLTVASGRSDISITNLTLDSDGVEAPRFAMQVGRNSGSLTERVHIQNLTIDTFRDRGIVVRTARHVKIEDCTFRGATALDGGEGYGVTIQQPMSDNNWVTGCYFGTPMRHGILLQFSTNHNLIEYNTLVDGSEDAIDLHGEDEYSNEVRFNTITGCERSAIGIGNTGSTHDEAGPLNWIHSNIIDDCRDGIELIEGSDNQYIENNQITNCDEYGIRLTNFAFMDAIENAVITGNSIDNCKRGIAVDFEAPNLFIDDNFISDNLTVGISTDSTVTSYTITNNILNCNGTPAAIGDNGGIFQNNTITNNCNVADWHTLMEVW